MEPLAVNEETAARLLGVGINSLRRLAKKSEIVKKKVGSRSLYPVASLKRFLEAK
jgi:hypothetical protein